MSYGDQQRDEDIGWEMRVQERSPELANLRRALDIPQKAMAEHLGVTAGAVSKVERARLETLQLISLRRYVEGLGGQLRIQARFGKMSIPLLGDGAPLGYHELRQLTMPYLYRLRQRSDDLGDRTTGTGEER